MTLLTLPGRPPHRLSRRLRTFATLAGLGIAALIIPACQRSQSGGQTTTSPGVLLPPSAPSVVLTSPVGVQSGLVPIHYQLSDPSSVTATITVEVSLNGGGAFQPASGGPGGEGASGLASSPAPGTAHTFMWNSVADGVGLAAAAGSVVFRITPRTTLAGAPVATASFTVNNTAHTPPSVVLAPVAGVQTGLVSISYSLVDADSDPCAISA